MLTSFTQLTNILSSSNVHKLAGLLAAAFGAFAGPGVTDHSQILVTAAGASYAAFFHLVDSTFNSVKGSAPSA